MDLSAGIVPPADLDRVFDSNPIIPSRRGDGWTGGRQRIFCEALAQGHSVDGACMLVGLTAASAYAFRSSARGAPFAIGWAAAQMLQRHRLADVLSVRAFEGQVVTITTANGGTIERHHYDNRLALGVLARLDRLAAGIAPGGAATQGRGGQGSPAASDGPAAEAHAARLAAGEFDRYLDILATGASPARAGLFLAVRGDDGCGTPELAAITSLARADLYARTGAGIVAEIDTHDLDPAARGTCTADQWARAEAAGLLTLAAPDPDPSESPCGWQPDPTQYRVWWSEADDAYRTDFPPPPGFTGDEHGAYGDDDYERDADDEERAAMAAEVARARTVDAAQDEQARTDWLIATQIPPSRSGGGGPPAQPVVEGAPARKPGPRGKPPPASPTPAPEQHAPATRFAPTSTGPTKTLRTLSRQTCETPS